MGAPRPAAGPQSGRGRRGGCAGELRRIARRDFFPPAEREVARAAVDALAAELAPAGAGGPPAPLNFSRRARA